MTDLAGRLNRALRKVRRALAPPAGAGSSEPSGPVAGIDASEPTLKSARRLRRAGALDGATAVLDELLKLNPLEWRAWRMQAKIGEEQGRWLDACEFWMRTAHAARKSGAELEAGDQSRIARLVAYEQSQTPQASLSDTLVLVERGVDPIVLGRLLTATEPLAVITDSPTVPPGLRGNRAVRTIYSFLTEGDTRTKELAFEVRKRVGPLFDELLADLDPEVRYADDVDVATCLRHDLLSGILQHLRVYSAGAEQLSSGRFEGVVFLSGDGRFRSMFQAQAAETLGAKCVRVLRGFGVEDAPVVWPQGPAGRPLCGGDSSQVPERIREGGLDAIAGRPWVFARRAPLYTATLEPVVRHLSSDGCVGVFALPGPARHIGAYDAYERAATQGYEVLLDYRYAGEAKTVGVHGVDRFEVPSVEAAIDVATRIVGNADLGSLECVRGQVATEVAGAIGVMLPPLHRFAMHLRREISVNRPSVLITAREKKALDRLTISVANALDVPTVLIQPLLDGEDPLHDSIEAKVVTVFDDFTQQLYERHFGRTPESIAVTGFPRFDQLRSGVGSAESESSDDGKSILLALQPFALSVCSEYVRVVAQVMSSAGLDAPLIVRLHPREPPERLDAYREVLDSLQDPPEFELSAEGDIGDLLTRSVVLISAWSNTIFEAAIKGIPAISLSLSLGEAPIPLDEMGVALSVDGDEELMAVLPRLVSDVTFRDSVKWRQRAYVQRNSHLTDDVSAVERIASVVREVVRPNT